MKSSKILNIKGILLDQNQLNNYLEKIASEHILQKKSNRNTYPIPRLINNFNQITKTYNFLNFNLKLGVDIHPAGEWLLDNYYVIEETYKMIKKNLSLKKYSNFQGISNGEYKGFARIYVLAAEIVAYTEGRIDTDKLIESLKAYQTRKTLSMEEIWNISVFFDIALIEKIRNVCDKIYFVQIQKYKVESIIERLIENKQDQDLVYKRNVDNIKLPFSKEPFIEYMSYRLNQYGKKGFPYMKILEEQVEKTGTSIEEIIKKEHFDIALKKLSIGNYIKTIKDIQRINFIEIFEKINGVEEILKKDPAKIYEKMTHKTKEYYRNTIKEIAMKNKISEIYLSNKALEFADKNKENPDKRKSHIGYYLIDKGINDLKKELNLKINIDKNKGRRYITYIITITSMLTLFLTYLFYLKTKGIIVSILFLIYAYIPISEIVIKCIQYIFSKTIKPQFIPKMDLSNGIDIENTTMVIMPTILKSKENVKEMLEKLEVYYLANKSKNIYFTLLGDCSTSSREKEDYDEEIIKAGKEIINKLNKKYKDNIFHFVYRKRLWNGKEHKFLGWERKRGIITEFNRVLLGSKENTFIYNSLEYINVPKIKYIITLDSDTNLVLESSKSMIGAMAHILNKPIIDNEKNIVVEGYGLFQPRIGVDINASRETLFTKIYAGLGGTDAYSDAISDIYQDNFGEGTFTGKGIYDLETFSKVLEKAIPENTVLSHDLLEGIYVRCGLLTDVNLLDSYPTKFNSYMARASRWIRGDWQIIRWLKKKIINKKGEKIDNPINELGKYKIFDNLRRSLLEITQLKCLILLLFLSQYNLTCFYLVIFLSIFIDLFIDILNTIIFKKEGVKKQTSFENKLPGLRQSIVRSVINFSSIIYRSIVYYKAIIKTLYRVLRSKEHLLEWSTADEVEKNSKGDLESYFKEMFLNFLVGLILFIISIKFSNIFACIISLLWLTSPAICWYISRRIKEEKKIEQLNKNEINEIIELARKTWKYFEDNLTEENNYLPPDNYQENRKEKLVSRTSSTNIGLGIMSIISAYDLKFIELEKSLSLIKNILNTVKELDKLNGHLYNWYDIKTLEPLNPKYVSTVDSGNFIGYLITLKGFLNNIEDKELENKYEIVKLIGEIDLIIQNTDFSKLYNESINLFSIGFNVQENKLTNSYYDLLASEARQASLIAIAKKDITEKHWNNLSRTLTTMDGKKGLVSWSGTAFEYLMPNINIKRYKGSLLDESCKFTIMSQRKYCNKLRIPWGISEAAFNLKDLYSNYQYKAFGIPWLGLKRGLGDDIVVSSYGSVLAIVDEPKEVLKNIRLLKRYNMYGKYGLYESIDFTPDRLEKNNKYEVVKTYMAHHQALILLSINNLINNNILQKRFHQNPEIKAVDILLQEKLPEDMIITKEKKEKVEKIKYKGYDSSYYKEIDPNENYLPISNVISNENYTIYMTEKGEGYSKYKNILINRYKPTDKYGEGIFFYFKNIKSKKIWTSFWSSQKDYKTIFTQDMSKIVERKEELETKIRTIITPNDNVEIRNIKIKNLEDKEQIIEISSVIEPVLSEPNQDYAHKAFNNLFLKYTKIEDGILVKRNKRNEKNDIYMAVGFFSNNANLEELEYEIDKEKLYGRLNYGIPNKIEQSQKFSNKVGLVVDPIIAFRRTIKIKPNEGAELNLVISISENMEEAINSLNEYKNFENVKKAFEISKTRNEEAARYLQINGNNIEIYQKILSYILNLNSIKKEYINKFKKEQFSQEQLWQFGISGDNPIILAKISQINDIYVIKELLKAYKYFESKNIIVDLVILNTNNQANLENEIIKEIAEQNILYLINNRIFIINSNKQEDLSILDFKANIIIDASKGSIKNSIIDQEDLYLQNINMNKTDNEEKYIEELSFEEYDIKNLNLKYNNGYGGFSQDGKEYIIKVNNKVPSVWSNVLANSNFGTIVTQNLGGFSWYKNSRLNRISKWSNDNILDTPSEEIFIQDEEEKKFWKIGKGNLLAKYGFGYSIYEQNKDDIRQNLKVFVSMKDNIKINLLEIKNNTSKNKKINLIYKIDTVLDEDEIKSNGNIALNFDKYNNVISARNLYNNDMNSIVYVYSSEKINSYTGNPDSINLYNNEELNFENSLGNYSCMAIRVSFEVKAFEEKKISLILGAKEKEEEFSMQYKDIEKCNQEYVNTINYWTNLLERVKVKTPDEEFNIIMNGWTMYQTISSRLYARSGFNQSGGAFGFRDQLQDVLGLKFLDIEKMKKQIIKHASHQFEEGDAEHWWHDETKRGIRTKFSDDRLWLVYATIQYIEFTGDKEILKEKIPYIKGEVLSQDKDEDYNLHLQTKKIESLYEHCKKAINVSLKLGKNNLPLIGSGDWNDGFSTVGNKGLGESIWLGFFEYYILSKFIEIAKENNENSDIIKKYNDFLVKLKKALNENGWDKNWYKRAITDDGKILGSSDNIECRIDSIAQSWSVISGAGEKDKVVLSMKNLEKYLVDKENEIIKLLDPPFENSELEPGYIKAYLPGVRENGGQYTHAAIWAIIALAILEEKDKVLKYFDMINPINHSNTREKSDLYKIEPYIIPADIYGNEDLLR